MTLKYFAIFIISLASICFIASVIMYGLNRAKYHELLSLFQKEHHLPAPYSFNSQIGFFGAPLIAYFFRGLKNQRKVFFLNKNSDSYLFFINKNSSLVKWISPFYYLFITSFFCYSFLIILAILLNAKEKIQL
ncbi:hypothetical protein EHS86_11510 [Erwinia amylovora]|nr:hypothetical protein AD997_01560 [Erwinia amylovora]RUT16383.1 hypothetical protein BEI72_17470 [Erwinia amylovora]RWS38043.1 hypothetical protein EHS86_11510 [Erwinia amylovora]